ncbi:DUF4097 family beta strand repeat-containing protein [Nocardioides insulae]|uniref:DUF4097 family beta strand repeat-containing protein n=1 Tax=Nocardioides insulae TaxID=394734 RepID=UPI000417DCF0|nr:DUF4097 family beta strand repeat-containing protein [Nocardioides insulae]
MTTQQYDHSFHTPGPIKLHIELGRGYADLTFSDTDRTTVVVAGRDADQCRVEQHQDHIAVIGPKRQGLTGSDLVVQVVAPTLSTLTSRTGSAEVRVAGVCGTARTQSGSGQVEFDRVEGSLVASSGSGDVRVAEAVGDVRVKSGSGDCSLGTTARSVVVSTGSGDAEIGRATGPVQVKTGSGSLRIAESFGQDVVLKTGSGDLELTCVHRGRVSTKGASGDVRIGVPTGVPVWTDITTVSGRIESALQPTGAPAEGQEHVELRLRTVSGDISLAGR